MACPCPSRRFQLHDSKTYKSTMDDFKIKKGVGRPIIKKVVNADSACDSSKIRNYN